MMATVMQDAVLTGFCHSSISSRAGGELRSILEVYNLRGKNQAGNSWIN